MIDRQARDVLSEQIQRFMAGLSDNLEFDKNIFDIKTQDAAVQAIRKQMWHAYDDLSRHRLNGKWAPSATELSVIRRFVLFLKTDLECRKPDKTTDWDCWPFSSRRQHENAMSDVE